MHRPPIPDDIIRFILLCIPSVPYLEAMLLLRSNSNLRWDCSQVAQRLYLSESAAQTLLSELHAGGMLEIVDPALALYRYQPKSDDLRCIIDQLADMYAKNLIGVTNLIHSKMNKKAQQFADAFIWRKDS